MRTLAAMLLAALTCMCAGAEEGTELRVMSFNVRYGTAKDGEDHWDKRKELLVATIKAFNPDLLGTQELVGFQGDFLREQLRGFTFFGAGRDDGDRKGEFSAIYFRTDRFERLVGGHFWLSETPDQPGSKSWDTAITRMVTWVKLRDRTRPAAEFYYFNTHWDHIGQQARLESAKLMRKRIEALGGTPIIVTGDFNTTEDGEPYKTLLGSGLTDSYRIAQPARAADEASFHAFKGGRSGSRIDWILYSALFATGAAAIDYTSKDGRYPSDHFPVTAVLRWK